MKCKIVLVVFVVYSDVFSLTFSAVSVCFILSIVLSHREVMIDLTGKGIMLKPNYGNVDHKFMCYQG